jgi:hypothetical protein
MLLYNFNLVLEIVQIVDHHLLFLKLKHLSVFLFEIDNLFTDFFDRLEIVFMIRLGQGLLEEIDDLKMAVFEVQCVFQS